MLFPYPKPTVQRRSWLLFLPYVIGLAVVVAFLARLYVFGWIWTAASLLGAILILAHSSFTMRDTVSRAQIRWGVGGMMFGFGLFFITYLVAFSGLNGPIADFLYTISKFGFGVVAVCLAIAITRYRLFDIDIIIRRTLVYGALTLTLALVYFGSVVLLQEVFQLVTGQSQSALVTVISTLGIAALFNRLRQRLQAVIDRRFFRKKYDATKILEAFTSTASNETNLDQLSSSLMSVVYETMQPEHVSLWLKPARRKNSSKD
jgi:hypothetical protein